MTDLGRRLLTAMALGLGLDERWFERTVTADPTVLFRVFRYPPTPTAGWGVAEHTDYGLLTLLAQDGNDGLEVRGPDGWIPVPGDADVLVVNLGDMLERMTGGRYRSTAAPGAQHRGHRPAVVPLLRRPVVGRPVPGDAARRRLDPGPHPRSDVAPLGSRRPAGVGGHLRRLPHGQGRQGVPRPGASDRRRARTPHLTGRSLIGGSADR